MKRVECYVTADGKAFPTQNDANIHAAGCYGELLTELANEATGLVKLSRMIEWMDYNRNRLAQLAVLHADTKLEDDE